MSELSAIYRLITDIYTQIELTHLECRGDNYIADSFTLRMSRDTFQRLRAEKDSFNFIPMVQQNNELPTLAGYTIDLQDKWDQEKLVYLHFEVYKPVDLNQVIPVANELARTVKKECSRGVDFEW